jgi:hypothetical protein
LEVSTRWDIKTPSANAPAIKSDPKALNPAWKGNHDLPRNEGASSVPIARRRTAPTEPTVKFIPASTKVCPLPTPLVKAVHVQ